MSITDRVLRIELLIKARGSVSFRELLEALEVSPATLKRDLEYLRSRLGAPIEYDRFANGYKLGAAARGPKHELPGLWFSERELYSLLMTHQLLSEIDGAGTIARHLQPLLERVHGLLGTTEAGARAIVKRVKIIHPARRPVPAKYFELAGEAVVRRQRLELRYFSRGRREASEREISPQRLVHHRGTWYVDAWCHRSEGLRRFALDAFEAARLLDEPAREVPLEQVQAEMDGGYGIYSGATRHWATLRFSAQAAQWVSHEQWHARQQGRWLDDGAYELRVPYAELTEIAMDVLRHGPQVQVLAPPELVAHVHRALADAARQYAAE
jgi:predicted DNA-binding transcriptional regulator YafY